MDLQVLEKQRNWHVTMTSSAALDFFGRIVGQGQANLMYGRTALGKELDRQPNLAFPAVSTLISSIGILLDYLIFTLN